MSALLTSQRPTPWLSLPLLALTLCACEEPDFNRLLEPIEAGGSSAGVSLSAGVSVAGVSAVAGGRSSAGVQLPAGAMMSAGVNTAGDQVSVGGASAGSEVGGDTAGSPPVNAQPLIVGRWESTGADVAPLLRDPSVGLTRLEATFLSDLRFVVGVENQDGYYFELEGSYELRPSPTGDLLTEGQVHEITVRQTLPDVAVSEGIWRVEGDTLQYEVVQVEPPLPGAQTPPQREGGFGSTNNGALGTDNIQLYRRAR